jgi:hypothetical protein
MAERDHDSSKIKVQTPLGIVKYNQRLKTHTTTTVTAPDPSGGHLSHGGSSTVPSKGVLDDNLPSTLLETEAISPGVGLSRANRMIKDSTSTLTNPTSPHDQYNSQKYAGKSFSGRRNIVF